MLDGKNIFQCFWSDPKTRVFECFGVSLPHPPPQPPRVFQCFWDLSKTRVFYCFYEAPCYSQTPYSNHFAHLTRDHDPARSPITPKEAHSRVFVTGGHFSRDKRGTKTLFLGRQACINYQ